MKRFFVFAAACMALLFCSCEHLYTVDELDACVDWSYIGWSEVRNETTTTVTMVTTYNPYGLESKEVTTVIPPGEIFRLRMGGEVPGESIGESVSVTIIFENGPEIVCTHGGTDPASERFYGYYQQRNDYEVVEIDGKKVRHDLIVLTYHINWSLLKLWVCSQE